MIIPTHEGDYQIWGRVININGQRDVPRDHYM